MKDVLTKQHQFAQPIAKVWAAITEQDQISKWFMPCDFKAQPGYRYSLISSGDDACERIYGNVITVNPVNELVYSWIVVGTETETIVSWNLEEKDGGTLLTLEHSGISKYPNQDTAIKMFESFTDGWGKCITHLDRFVAGEKVESAHGRME